VITSSLLHFLTLCFGSSRRSLCVSLSFWFFSLKCWNENVSLIFVRSSLSQHFVTIFLSRRYSWVTINSHILFNCLRMKLRRETQETRTTRDMKKTRRYSSLDDDDWSLLVSLFLLEIVPEASSVTLRDCSVSSLLQDMRGKNRTHCHGNLWHKRESSSFFVILSLPLFRTLIIPTIASPEQHKVQVCLSLSLSHLFETVKQEKRCEKKQQKKVVQVEWRV
jgi:hypothetical protein